MSKTKTIDMKIYEELSLDLDQVKTQLNPIITGLTDKAIVSIYASEKEKMTISIYDGANNIGNYILKGEGYIGQKFCLESLHPGTYNVIVKHRGRTFIKEITI